MLKNYFFNPTGCDKLYIRSDPWGDGHYGAKRTKPDGTIYYHKGVDLICTPGQEIYAPIDAIYERIVYAYPNDIYTGCILRSLKAVIKLLYFTPSIKVGNKVKRGQVIGVAQDISKRYSDKMTPHNHFELMGFDGSLLF